MATPKIRRFKLSYLNSGFESEHDSNSYETESNVDLYHWSSTKFSSTWYDTLSVLVAKGRAKVSVAASEADWSKRICEMQYADYEDHTVGS